MARISNIEFESGESVFQSKFSIIYNSSIFKKYDLKSYFFYKKRQFQNKLPFQSDGQNEIKRDYIGFSSIIDKESIFLGNNNKISLGFEYLDQFDLRSRFDNIQGKQGQLIYKNENASTYCFRTPKKTCSKNQLRVYKIDSLRSFND